MVNTLKGYALRSNSPTIISYSNERLSYDVTYKYLQYPISLGILKPYFLGQVTGMACCKAVATGACTFRGSFLIAPRISSTRKHEVDEERGIESDLQSCYSNFMKRNSQQLTNVQGTEVGPFSV
jgi:hypothetical protein